jgi:adenylate cyclase
VEPPASFFSVIVERALSYSEAWINFNYSTFYQIKKPEMGRACSIYGDRRGA